MDADSFARNILQRSMPTVFPDERVVEARITPPVFRRLLALTVHRQQAKEGSILLGGVFRHLGQVWAWHLAFEDHHRRAAEPHLAVVYQTLTTAAMLDRISEPA